MDKFGEGRSRKWVVRLYAQNYTVYITFENTKLYQEKEGGKGMEWEKNNFIGNISFLKPGGGARTLKSLYAWTS